MKSAPTTTCPGCGEGLTDVFASEFGDEIADGPRDEDLARVGHVHDPVRDTDGITHVDRLPHACRSA
jgi:hypothetical protein